MGISWFVSLGDKCDVSGNDLLQFWEDDEHDARHRDVHRAVRQPAQVRSHRPACRPHTADRRGPHRRRGDRLGERGAVPAGRPDRGADRPLDARHRPRPRDRSRSLRGPAVAVLTNSRSPGVLATAALAAAGLVARRSARRLDWRATPQDFAASRCRPRSTIPASTPSLVIHAPPIQSAPAPVDEVEDAAAAGRSKPVARGDARPARRADPSPAATCRRSRSPNRPPPCSVGCTRYSRWLETEAEATTEPLDRSRRRRGRRGDRRCARARRRRSLDLADAFRILAAYGVFAPHSIRLTGTPPRTRSSPSPRVVGHPVALKATRRRVGRSAEAGIALDLSSDEAIREAVAVMQASLGRRCRVARRAAHGAARCRRPHPVHDRRAARSRGHGRDGQPAVVRDRRGLEPPAADLSGVGPDARSRPPTSAPALAGGRARRRSPRGRDHPHLPPRVPPSRDRRDGHQPDDRQPHRRAFVTDARITVRRRRGSTSRSAASPDAGRPSQVDGSPRRARTTS